MAFCFFFLKKKKKQKKIMYMVAEDDDVCVSLSFSFFLSFSFHSRKYDGYLVLFVQRTLPSQTLLVPVSCLSFDHATRTLFAGLDNGEIKVWRNKSVECMLNWLSTNAFFFTMYIQK
jgi:hypothetical protein